MIYSDTVVSFSNLEMVEYIQRICKTQGYTLDSKRLAEQLDIQDDLVLMRKYFFVPKVGQLPDCDKTNEGIFL